MAPVSFRGIVSVCYFLISSYEETSCIGSGPTHMTSFFTTLKAYLQRESHSEVLGVRTTTYDFEGNIIQAIKPT